MFENQMINLHLFYFTSYRLKSHTILSVQKIKDGDRTGWLVGSQISRFQGASLTVGWVVLQTSEGLRIFDMQINGYSFKIQQREDYGALSQQNGGTDQGLLKFLKHRSRR